MKLYYPVFKSANFSFKELFQKLFPKPKREKTCNFCHFAEPCGLADGIVCTEEHHQEGKDRWQYYCHKCEYFKDDKRKNIYKL